ncbi:MAG: alpha/beta fold hydrolase [Armatimonadota bacterium]
MILEVNGASIYYETEGEGIPLLCLPAFPFDGRMWREQRSLRDVAQVIVPDFRGTGRSSVTEGPYTMELLAEDMFSLLDQLQIDRAVIMGVSMGVYAAFAMFAADPKRFRGFIIADSRTEADNPQTVERRKKTVEGLMNEGTGILHDRVNDLFAATTRRERPELVEEMQAIAREQNPRGLAEETLGMALRPDRTSLLPCIQAPTLVVCGDEDTVSPCDGMRQLASRIPGARFQVIPQAGHLSPLEQPAAFNALVRDFLESLPAFEM